MRKIILKDVEAEKEEIRQQLNIKETKEVKNDQTTSQPQQQYQYQHPQQNYNPFQQDTKYEFMLFAMNPTAGALYQILKLFNLVLYSIGYLIGKLIRIRRMKKSSVRVIIK
jgi:hypothetical protein